MQITAESGDRSGEAAQNMFCLQSSFQYLSSGPSVKVSSLYAGVASSNQTVSWSRGEWGTGVTSGRGLGLGCCHPRCMHAYRSAYLPLRDLRIVSELGVTMGSWKVIEDIRVGVFLPVCMTAVGGSFVNHCFHSGGGQALFFWLYSNSLP